MGNFFNGAGAVFFRKVFVNRTVILHAVEVIGRMADAVEVTAEADMVIVAHEVQHIVDMAVNTFDFRSYTSFVKSPPEISNAGCPFFSA